MTKKSKNNELKSNQIEIMKMIWKISRGTGYIYQMQLSDFLLFFKIFSNQNTINKTLSGLTSQGYLQKATYNNGRRILVLTHKATTTINLDVRKKIEFKPITLHENTIICKLLYDLIVRYGLMDFWDFMNRLECQHSSILMKKSGIAAIEYYKKILSGNDRNSIMIGKKWVSNHIESLGKYNLQMLQNINGSETQDKDDYSTRGIDNILLLAKKNIYVYYISKLNTIIYIKILDYSYGREKIKSDLEHIDIYHEEIYPDYFSELVIVTANLLQVEFIREEIKDDPKLNKREESLSVDFVDVEEYFEVRV